jgi:DNA-binding NtrC family response regulator
VAATHRDLPEMVRTGQFRGDLFHRLAVFPIFVPPLRERTHDLIPLAEALLTRLAAAAARAVPRLTPAAATRLRAAAWPGNVRELRNALERALILDDTGTLDAELFADAGPSATQPSDGPETLELLERRAIVDALTATAGNRREAAARLGIGLRTLYEKLKRYDLK